MYFLGKKGDISPMHIMDKIIDKAKASAKRIVLPEGNDDRIVEAAKIIAEKGIAKVIVLGGENVCKQFDGVDNVTVVDPCLSEKRAEYANLLFELRKAKGMTEEKAAQIIQEPMYFAAVMLKNGDADGMVGGAIHATADTLRPALQIIKTAPGISIVSSCFFMQFDDEKIGDDGVLVFADCAVNENPNSDELAAIAVATAKTANTLIGIEPKIAMLSFSTKGSASGAMVEKVSNATEKVKELNPDIKVDGELQADAALVASVGKLKCPGSEVAGEANILVFPDLQSGNIGYKLVQRLAGAEAIGPICQGFNIPVNDLSRGCSVEDIVNVVAITAVQA